MGPPASGAYLSNHFIFRERIFAVFSVRGSGFNNNCTINYEALPGSSWYVPLDYSTHWSLYGKQQGAGGGSWGEAGIAYTYIYEYDAGQKEKSRGR